MDFLSGTRLLLRAIEPEDVSFVYRWENDPSAWGDGCALAPYSRYAIRTYIEESQRQDIFQSRQLRLMIVCQNDKSVAGMVDLFDFDPYHRRAAVGIYVDTRYRKQGMASEALELLCRYAFDFLHLHQLYAHVAERQPVYDFSRVPDLSGAGFCLNGFAGIRDMKMSSSCSVSLRFKDLRDYRLFNQQPLHCLAGREI